MKRIVSVFLLSATWSISHAQISVPKIDKSTATTAAATQDFIKPPAIGDVGSTSNSMADMLTSKLSLPNAQKPKLTEAFSGFLNNKKGIMGLAASNPTSYLSKFNPLQQGLFGKMKGIMGAGAFTKFLGMKPSGNNIAGNALSNLFF
jgi:hypothetical protein